MTEHELSTRLEECRQNEARRQTAGDGGVHSMDEIIRELLADYQPMLPSANTSPAPQLVAC